MNSTKKDRSSVSVNLVDRNVRFNNIFSIIDQDNDNGSNDGNNDNEIDNSDAKNNQNFSVKVEHHNETKNPIYNNSDNDRNSSNFHRKINNKFDRESRFDRKKKYKHKNNSFEVKNIDENNSNNNKTDENKDHIDGNGNNIGDGNKADEETKNVKQKNVEQDNTESGDKYPFHNKWIVWRHDIETHDWSFGSYIKLFTIENMKDFWSFFNNVYILDVDKYYFFIMKNNSHPTWEHPTNRNGGVCSVKVAKNSVCELVEQMAVLLVNESFSDIPDDINGLSFGNKPNHCIVKIWNKDYNNDTTKHIPEYICKKYRTHPRYKVNTPEF
jgi:hypothetical protein